MVRRSLYSDPPEVIPDELISAISRVRDLRLTFRELAVEQLGKLLKVSEEVR